MKLDIGSQIRSGMLLLQHKPQVQKQGLCPTCGSNDIQDDIMTEGQEQIPISKCQCGWYGTRIESTGNPRETKMEKKCMSIAETKLGVTMVLSKADCKEIGIDQKTTTKEAIKEIRKRLKLPEKSMKD